MPIPKVSVIVPVYNVERYLPECLDSICSQSLREIEIICINDGSTDSSLDILEKHAASDSRFKIITQFNSGVSVSRKNGLSQSCGEYIFFVDADDKIAVSSLELLLDNSIRNDTDIVFLRAFYWKDGIVTEHPETDLKDCFPAKIDFSDFTFKAADYPQLILNKVPALWTKFMKADFLKKYDDWYFPPKYGGVEDLFLNCQMVTRAASISFCDVCLYYYRISNQTSLMHVFSESERIFEIFDTVSDIKAYLLSLEIFENVKDEFLLFAVSHFKCWYGKVSPTLESRFYEKMREQFISISKGIGRLSSYLKKLRYDNYVFYKTVIETSTLEEFKQREKSVQYKLLKSYNKLRQNFVNGRS